MVSFAIETLARVFRLVVPALLQCFAIKIIRNHISRRVITTCKNCTRMDAIQVASRSQVAFATVTVVVAPVALAILALHMLVDVSTRHKINRRNRSAISTAENGQVFRSLEHKAVAVTVILGLVANRLACSVDCTVGGLHNHFRLAVAIVVKDLELRIMSTRTDVLAKVNAPQALAVELVGIDKHRTRITRLRVIVCVRRIPLQNQFVFAVAIEVGSTHIVRNVSALFTVRHRLSSRNFKFNRLVGEGISAVRDRLIQNERQTNLGLFFTIDNGSHRVLGGRCARSIKVARAGRLTNRGNLLSITIEDKFRRRVVGAQQAPANQHTLAHV